MRHLAILTFAAALLACSSATAQQSSEDPFVLSFAGPPCPANDIAVMVSKITNLPVAAEPELLKKGVATCSGDVRTAKRNFPLLAAALLYRSGIELVITKRALHLLPTQHAPTVAANPSAALCTPDQLHQHKDRKLVLTTVRLQHRLALHAGAMLRACKSGVEVGAPATAQWLFVQGAPKAVRRACQLLGSIDLPVEKPISSLDSGFGFTEGPAWSPQRKALLFSDIRNNRIMQWDGSKTSVFLEPSERANGLTFDSAGNLFACCGGSRRVMQIAPDGSRKVIADSYDGKKLNSPNDLTLDQHGGLYFTDPRYGKQVGLEQPVMGVYYVAKDRTVTRVIDNLQRPNGIVLSTDHKLLFVADPRNRAIMRYPVQAPGKLGKGTVFFRSVEALDRRGPDGMAVDATGNVYATYKNLLVIDKNGKLRRRIAVPEQPSNCTIGGKDGKTLFITARTGLYASTLK